MHRLTLAALAAALLSPAASAAVMVLGEGPGHACYESAKRQEASKAALDVCSQAILDVALTPRDRAASFSNRAVIRLNRAEGQQALADCERALALGQDFAATFINKGAALIMLKRFEEARTALDSAVSLAEGADRLPALVNRAMAREELGDVKGAYADLQAALAIKPDYAPALKELERFTLRGS
jgi:tetratricopeptide (TPR) repeat protein